MLAFSARAVSPYTECEYRTDDRLVFGCESTGLGSELLELADPHIYRIPIVEEGVRSLNLSNAVSIVVYEARRQLGL